MSSTKPIDRAIKMFQDATPPFGSPMEEYRSGFDNLCLSFPLPGDAIVKEVDAGGVPCFRVSAPGVANDKLIVHFHSGGYVMGSAYGYREFAYRLSKVVDAPVLVPDYRLAPEHPFPAPVEDALAVYRWVLQNYDAKQVFTSGDSAGGGLVLALMVAARDEGLPLPVGTAAISPLTDLACEGASYSDNKDRDPLINWELAIGMGQVYIGERDPKQTLLACPLYADHSGLPPILLFASESEVLRDDATRFADSVRAAGGEAYMVLQPGMIHIWPLFPFLPESQLTLNALGDFVKERFKAANKTKGNDYGGMQQ